MSTRRCRWDPAEYLAQLPRVQRFPNGRTGPNYTLVPMLLSEHFGFAFILYLNYNFIHRLVIIPGATANRLLVSSFARCDQPHHCVPCIRTTTWAPTCPIEKKSVAPLGFCDLRDNIRWIRALDTYILRTTQACLAALVVEVIPNTRIGRGTLQALHVSTCHPNVTPSPLGSI